MSSASPPFLFRLVIVESPAKCQKIQSFLGDGWTVLASMGHIRALDERLDAVGIDSGWTPQYRELPNKAEAIAKLKRAARGATEVWLATDDDREGEGIAWHICHVLGLNPATTPRIVFHEITRGAIQAAVAAPRRLDMNRVNAQQARAMLDMLVGFTISRVLWKRVAPRLSAGRCQTPALRLVAEREAEIAAHEARNYWTLFGTLHCHGSVVPAPLEIRGEGEHAEAAVRELLGSLVGQSLTATIRSVKERVATSNAPAPLITSTLQQEASASHGLNPKQTMAAAQKLYEAGHITYMRTDNAVLSGEAAAMMRSEIIGRWGAEFVGPVGQHTGGGAGTAGDAVEAAAPEPKQSKPKKTTKKAAAKEAAAAPEPQAAHEAIRPTHPDVEEPLGLERDQQIVYRLVRRRAMQCQMAAAKTQVRSAVLSVSGCPEGIVWNAEQTRPQFDGWRVVERTTKSEEAATQAQVSWDAWTPHLISGTAGIPVAQLGADEVFTKPTGRYTEATLIRELEKRGIGRPSTFASLVTTLFDREYVEKTNAADGRVFETRHLMLAQRVTETKQKHKAGAEKNKIRTTALGESVTRCLVSEFSDLFAYAFTAQMETSLDEIAGGRRVWQSILQETWDSYRGRYLAAMAEKDARVRPVEGTAAKVVQTKKGPMLVRPRADGGGDEWAPVPAGGEEGGLTEEAINAAFQTAATARDGELVGVWNDVEIRKKRGPYGWYVDAGGVKVPWTSELSLEDLISRLESKSAAFERVVGAFVIKQGPYGLYFYRTGGKGKPKFVKFVGDKDAVTEAELEVMASGAPRSARKKP